MWKILAWGALLISAYWLWPIYLIAGIIIACAVASVASPGGGSSYRPRRATKYKPFKYKPIKFKKRVVYKAPKYRYKKPKPRPKGRKLKDGHTQYMKKMGSKRYWTPHSRWKDLPD